MVAFPPTPSFAAKNVSPLHWTLVFHRVSLRRHVSANAATSALCRNTANLRYALKNTRSTDEVSRSESGDPVCRPIRLSLFRFSLHLACAAKPQGGSHL